jgi:hypothetical protein
MKLHMRGIKVPALGSPRDRVYRDYLVNEQRLEAKKQELSLYIAIGSMPEGTDRREWISRTKKSFDAYVSLMWGIEPQDYSDEERKLMNYYTKIVKKSKLLVRAKNGEELEATGDIIDFLKKD